MFTAGFEKTAISVKWIAKNLNPGKQVERLKSHFFNKAYKASQLNFKSMGKGEDALKAKRMRKNMNKMHAALRRNAYDSYGAEGKKAVLDHVKGELDIKRQVREKMMEYGGKKGNA